MEEQEQTEAGYFVVVELRTYLGSRIHALVPCETADDIAQLWTRYHVGQNGYGGIEYRFEVFNACQRDQGGGFAHANEVLGIAVPESSAGCPSCRRVRTEAEVQETSE